MFTEQAILVMIASQMMGQRLMKSETRKLCNHARCRNQWSRWELHRIYEKSGTRYIAIDGPSSTSGRKPTLNQTGISGWLSNYITKDAKDPAKVTQLFTYLIDEPGQILTKYGVEGVTYAYNDQGKIDYLPEVKKLEQTDNDAYNKNMALVVSYTLTMTVLIN